MNQIDNKKRNLIRGAAIGSIAVTTEKLLTNGWVKPTINAVILPAHAQTSVCSITLDSSSFIGDWRFANTNGHPEDYFDATFNTGGSGTIDTDDGTAPVTWQFAGPDIFQLEIPSLSTSLIGSVTTNESCEIYISVELGGDGTFVGEKTI